MSDDELGDIGRALIEYYDQGAGWYGGNVPRLPCPGCQEHVGMVGSNLRAKAAPYTSGDSKPDHVQNCLALRCHGCGDLLAIKVINVADKKSVQGEIRRLKRGNVEYAALFAGLTEQRDMLTRWEGRLQSQATELAEARDLKAENRRLQQELVVALNEAVKLRTLAERRYAELSELRGATT